MLFGLVRRTHPTVGCIPCTTTMLMLLGLVRRTHPTVLDPTSPIFNMTSQDVFVVLNFWLES
jgi:hypothetical protein